MKEILEEYALIAEIISAVGVIISLIFVGFQVRGNTKATQASTFHQIAALDINILLSLGHTKESSRIITTFRGNPDALLKEEQDQGFHLFGAEIRHVENLWLQNENKMLSKRDWEARRALVEGMVLSPGFGALLKSPNKRFFDGSFMKYGENLRKIHLKKSDDFENNN
ncbi:hypothetical protein PP182_12845 [Maribacter sp. PR1]|uniref:Uncharacterized protein n=1 Tax=Maribacter cobaltidurans TaxID=1178778 RepID=A0ABU7IVJ5_9FLAO|nr:MULTISPECIES: hypothetical protein [Maribacter]MDC6389578.1 hypothetical protein [Maribacter sp. PR1]MEE1976967.1 hypothetical protein [Maribacter cobaltidurans]